LTGVTIAGFNVLL